MSKIYEHYLELKEKDSNSLYLFKSGKFYIFIAEDADRINDYVVLKQTKFTNNVNKCGFPDTSYDQYMRVFKNHNLDIVEINAKTINEINNISPKQEEIIAKYQEIKNIINSIDINETTPVQALCLLTKIKEFL